MCNDFGNRVAYDEYVRSFRAVGLPLCWPTTPPNLEPRDDIWPTDPAPVIRRRGQEWFCFAGFWRAAPDGAGEAVTLLTTEAGPDVAPIHDRQVVVLDRADWAAWLDLTKPEAALLRPSAAGELTVERVR
jgi:putative SOS response-associated peptidase YedK